MACKTSCKLCPHLVLSQSVTFANDTLTINIPAGSYAAGEKYCLVIAQALPDTTTINAPVVITIGAGTTAYPLTDCNCAQATAESIHLVRAGLIDGLMEIASLFGVDGVVLDMLQKARVDAGIHKACS